MQLSDQLIAVFSLGLLPKRERVCSQEPPHHLQNRGTKFDMCRVSSVLAASHEANGVLPTPHICNDLIWRPSLGFLDLLGAVEPGLVVFDVGGGRFANLQQAIRSVCNDIRRLYVQAMLVSHDIVTPVLLPA